jgi:hypothetical protein
MSEMNGLCFLVNMLSLKNWDDPIFQTGLPILTDLAYVSPNFNCYDPPVMCITYYMFTHTKLLDLSDV